MFLFIFFFGGEPFLHAHADFAFNFSVLGNLVKVTNTNLLAKIQIRLCDIYVVLRS